MSTERPCARNPETNSDPRHSADMRIIVQLTNGVGQYRTEEFEMAWVPRVGEVLIIEADKDDPEQDEPEVVTVIQVRHHIGIEVECHRVELLTMPKRLVDLADVRTRGILPL